MNEALIIAEAGVNHNGDIDLAKQLIDEASGAGADIIKFQTFKADDLVTKNATKASYQVEGTNKDESQYDMLRRLELTYEMHCELIAHCHLRNIKFCSTAYDISGVNMLLNLGQQIIKIPSGEITNLPYLRHIGGIGKPIILSTGMSDMEDISRAISALELSGTDRSRITVMHCTTEYPAPMSEVNLAAMLSIKKKFSVRVGYSDHTQGIEIPIAAVALGASIIEKHFTINRNLPGPDHKASIDVSQLREMVKSIRNVEKAIGDGVKRITVSEAKNLPAVRKSLFASQAIQKGEMFTKENIIAKRPGTGISPMRWDEIIGSYASRNFLKDEQIEI